MLSILGVITRITRGVETSVVGIDRLGGIKRWCGAAKFRVEGGFCLEAVGEGDVKGNFLALSIFDKD